MNRIDVYKLPAAGEHRERLRQRGQFWTPDWIAEAMCAYALQDDGKEIFDPAVGAGAFFRAARRVANRPVTLRGMEIDPKVLEEAQLHGLTASDLAGVSLGDFVFQPPAAKMMTIVANPPYLRHHRIPAEQKEKLRQFSRHTLGKALDGRTGLHIFFLIRALTLLENGGRLAFIMPADTCEGKSAPDLWRWIAAHYRLDAVVTFTPSASPFPNVDTNPLIFFIRKAEPSTHFLWVACDEARTDALSNWAKSGLTSREPGLSITERALAEGLTTGLSRPPAEDDDSMYTLGDFVHVQRGIATGANEFFFLTGERSAELGIPGKFLKRAVGRTRDIPGSEVTEATLKRLEKEGRPTWLLSLGAEPTEHFPARLGRYLTEGEIQGLPSRALISQRKPWYKMESRTPPPFLFSYLGRRNSRFIRNQAGVVPLTGFLCIYPRSENPGFLDILWTILNHPDTVANLPKIGKSYGGGAIKVEPRSLERLPIPTHVLEQAGLPTQLRLFQIQRHYQSPSSSQHSSQHSC